MRIELPDIRHNQFGFEALVFLKSQTEELWLETIDIDMKLTTWFDADMCAAFGAILYRLGERLNTVKLNNISENVEIILSKNGFLSHYGRNRFADTWGTTITYQRFDVKDDRYFAGYIEKELIHRSEIPKMSAGLLKKFRESIFEIFSNAVLHSQTKYGVFSCGQFYPRGSRLNFSVADLGIGIRGNVKEIKGFDFPAEDAIDWATREHNTTKRGNIPGGLGLKLLCEFVDHNGGNIQILSDAGYWRRENRNVTKKRINDVFPGTVVNIEINTADTHSYQLACENRITENDIF
ncbi:hypothetical protein SMSP2_00520 [Limihaloglobus sulfuriphilus]|uniref:Uncharacterized protein n=1 Tax=Limihaloglobus sulfuriphilus TaxID=1851148 RepID=A0A1Q2MCZ3_9BACT|nr:sensor histidine kinase [Limihaloglobus sulfuriphilus]AQQ70177.1 hypothetical protein SMSP2_00520 [Limihaloglobus sulfuriphilus]